jgi:hypothetical protein
MCDYFFGMFYHAFTLSQSHAIVDVHNAMAIQIISNDVDWYGILQVSILFHFYLFLLIIMFIPTFLKF